MKNGFTLTELIVTIIIVGTLAAVAIPRFSVVFERVRASEGVGILTALLRAQRAYNIEWGAYTNDVNDLDVTFPNITHFNAPTASNPGNPVAAPIANVTRTGSYTLGINEEGSIRCTDGGGGFTCAQAGIKPNF